MPRRAPLLWTALVLAGCSPKQPPLPSVILPGLDRRVEAVQNSTTTASAPPTPALTPVPLSTTQPRPDWVDLPPPQGPPAPIPVTLVPTPEGRFAVLSERFYFELPRGWKPPVTAPGGATLIDGEGRAGATVAFHQEGSADWSPADEVRRRLRSQGSVEDPPDLETVTLSGRFAIRRRWTTHRYKGKLLGTKEEVLYSETLLVPDPEGIYLISFRAAKAEFKARRAGFSELLKSLRLPKAHGPLWQPDVKSRRLALPAAD